MNSGAEAVETAIKMARKWGYTKKGVPEGEALPSVRTVASEFQLNPITVSKSYQTLVDEGLVEKRRGLGMFVCEGARRKLIDSERAKFLTEEWPAMLSRIEQLGLSIEELLADARQKEADSS